MTTDSKRRRRRLDTIKLNEISAVTKPAQEGATKVLFKSADSIEKRIAMTTENDGHVHILDTLGFMSEDIAGFTSFEDDHSHPWLRLDDGTIVIGAANGHDHEIAFNDEATLAEVEEIIGKVKDPEQLRAAKMVQECVKKAASGGEPRQMEKTMPDKNKETADLEAQVAEMQDALKAATALAGMSDAQKAFFAPLGDDAKKAFLAKTGEERDVDIAKAAELVKGDDPVAYTTTDGHEIRKSAGPAFIAMAKRADEQAVTIAKQAEDLSKADLRKRAETDFSHMSGDIEHRAELVKAVDGIKDEDAHKGVQAILKAANDGMAKGFITVGHTGGSAAPTSLGSGATLAKSSAEAELDTLAKNYATEKSVNYYEAYDVVADLNPELAAQAVG